VFVLCFSTFSVVFATEKTNDDMNDFNHYTTASKIAYAASWNLFRFYGTLVHGNMDSLSDVADYFTQLDQRGNQQDKRPAYVVNVSVDDLRPGDIVHVKNRYSFGSKITI
jgi:hypothetical protein